MAIDFEKIKKEMDTDKNVALLESNFPEEYLLLLQKQEGHDIGATPDENGTLTSRYGITEKGLETLERQMAYSTTEVPEYVKNSWEVLKDENNWTGKNKKITEQLAKRVSQYYQLSQSVILDGYTNNKFSLQGQNTRCMALIENNRFSMFGFEDSLLVQGIRRNNPAMIARSFFSSGKKDEKGNWILDEKGEKKAFPFSNKDEKRYQELFNAKAVFSDHIPTPEEYVSYERKARVNGKGPVKPEIWELVNNTLTHFENKIEVDKNYWMPDNYKNKDIKKGRKEKNTITHENVMDGKDAKMKKLDTPIIGGGYSSPDEGFFNKLATDMENKFNEFKEGFKSGIKKMFPKPMTPKGEEDVDREQNNNLQ